MKPVINPSSLTLSSRDAVRRHCAACVAVTVPTNNMDGPTEDAVCKSGLADLIAGALSGVAVVAIGQPLDTVKTKMQTFRGLYAGPTHCLKHTYLAGGVRGLYAGTTPAMVASVAENSVLFACYGVCQRAVASITGAADAKQMDTLSNAVAGCAASFFSSVVLCPTELVKIKMQAGRELAEARGQAFRGSVCRVTMVGTHTFRIKQ